MSYLFFFKQKTAYEMRISDWSSDVCSSDLALGAIFAGVSGVVVDLLARKRRTAWHTQRNDTALRVICPLGKHLELATLHRRCDVAQFHGDAQVGFVRTVAAHRFGIAQARERGLQLDALHVLENLQTHGLDEILNVALADERE